MKVETHYHVTAAGFVDFEVYFDGDDVMLKVDHDEGTALTAEVALQLSDALKLAANSAQEAHA